MKGEHTFYEKRVNPEEGGDGNVYYTCEHCGHKQKLHKDNPSVKEVYEWLKKIQCSKCKKRKSQK